MPRFSASQLGQVADDFFPESQRLVELFTGDPIAGLKATDGGDVRGIYHGLLADPRDGQALAEWLGYERRGSFDDRTLVVLFRSPVDDAGAAADATPQAAAEEGAGE